MADLIFDGKQERLRGGRTVDVMRVDDTHVAIIFSTATKQDADHLERNTLDGLRRGEFKMRLRGKPTGEVRRG